MKIFLMICMLCFVYNAGRAQYNGSEIGLDLTFHSSKSQISSGTFGLGLKYGFKYGEYFILGPSLRYQRLWTNNTNVTTGATTGYNIFGGGAFVHARFFNALFLGVEYELLNSPYNKLGYLIANESTLSSTLFVGGGFSMEFQKSVRLNVGIMYDIINSVNSPFRNSYFLKKYDVNGNVVKIMPVIYRIAFFFPLPYQAEEEPVEEEY